MKKVSLVLAAAGCILLLLGTFLPYVSYGPGSGDVFDAVLDVDHVGNTWPYALSVLVAVAAVPLAAAAFRRRTARFGAFLLGLGLVVFLDFLGAYVIGPTTYQQSVDLGAGGVLGSVGGALLLAAGAVALRGPATEAEPAGGRPCLDAARRWRVGQTGLIVILVAVGVNAALGIVAILFGDFDDSDDLAVKTVASSFCVTGGLLAGLACVPAVRRGSLTPIPLSGLCLSAIGFGLLLAGVWGQWSSTQFWKITASLVVAALGCAWASLLSGSRLPMLHPLLVASVILVFASGIATVAAIWALTESGTFWRMYGMLFVLATSTTVAAIVAGGSRATDGRAGAKPAVQRPVVG